MRKALSSLSVTAYAITLFVACHFALAATEVGQPAPPLVAYELNGDTFDLGALRGETVIVNFWATWCGPCRTEMPALDAFYRQHHSQGLELIGISVDQMRDSDDVVKTMKAFSYPAAMLRKVKENGFGAPKDLPVTYVVDRRGVLKAILTPDHVEITERSLDDIVLPLLK